MSRIRRMSNIRHYRISHCRKYAITKRTPIGRLNASQRLRLHLLQVNLIEYRMQHGHTLIEHVKTFNNMIQVIIFNINILNEESKYDALYNTLPLNYKGNLHLISESGEANNYETLVYLFLEANTWHNLTKSVILTESPNLRSSRGKVKGMPWLKKLSTIVLERENIAESIPRREH